MTVLIVSAVELGLGSALGGVAGTRTFVDNSRTAAKIYFDTYYPQYADLSSEEAINTWDA